MKKKSFKMFGRRHFTNVLQSLCIRGPTSASLGISLLCSLMNQICFLLPFPLSRTVFVASCLDYCNALLYGVAKTEIQRLQTVMNAAARLGLGRYDHVTPVLRDTLHWLPIRQQVVFKLAVLAFDCVRGTCPSHFRGVYTPLTEVSGRLRGFVQHNAATYTCQP